jgi:hypothetical protein
MLIQNASKRTIFRRPFGCSGSAVKKLIIVALISLVAPQITRAQGTTCVSNLGQPTIGTRPIGSDSWLGAPFLTGNNFGGYLLNFIQLGTSNSSGSPGAFKVMIYTGERLVPGSSLGSLSGSLDPSTTGVYDYAAPPGLLLAPRTHYNIVVTAGTPIANGAYEWSHGGLYNTSDGWIASFTGGPGSFYSTDGSSWH